MFVAGIDAHATYLVVGVVSNTGELVEWPTRIANSESERLLELLARYEPIEAVVETSPAWPCAPQALDLVLEEAALGRPWAGLGRQ